MANVEHGSLAYGEQHVIHFAEYATSTLREAATGLTANDDHKVALQTDDHSLWVLTDYTGPTWVPMIGTPGDDTVTGAKIVDDAIDSEHYTDASIDLAHMSVNSIDSDQYVDGSIDKAHLAADIVDGTKIADDAIDSEHYTDGSIDLAHMSVNSIDGGKIIAGVIQPTHLASSSVESSKIAAGAVTKTKIGADAVDDTKIGDAKIKKEHINADVVGTGLTGGAGTALSVDGIKDAGGTELKVKVFDIGDWDMDNVLFINVAHGLTLGNIRTVSVMIRNDNDNEYYPLDYVLTGTVAGYSYATATNIVVARVAGGLFDSAAFVTPPSSNRGFITIWYVA